MPPQTVCPAGQPREEQLRQAPPPRPHALNWVPATQVPGEPLQHPPLQAEKLELPQLVVQVCVLVLHAWSAGQSVGRLQPPLELPHTPLTHVVPDAHTLPHPPQLLESLPGFVQAPLQRIWPDVQPPLEPPQFPLTQGTPLAHAVPQAPQLEGSEDPVVQ